MRRRRGAMASNPPLRGQARRDFRQAQREAVASGGPAPTQAQFRPRPQQRPRPSGGQMGQQIGQVAQGVGMTGGGQAGQDIGQIANQVADQAGQQFGQMPPDKMYRFPQPAGGQGATLGAAMGNLAGSRQEGSPFAQQYMQQQQQQRPQVFNAFPGNNPANMNQANFGNFGNMRYPGGSPNFNEANSAVLTLPAGQQWPSMDQFFQKGQIQNGLGNFTQMPQPSANNGGKYRLSPGVYGTREQAMGQWARQPAVQGAVKAPGNLSQFDLSQAVPYGTRRR